MPEIYPTPPGASTLAVRAERTHQIDVGEALLQFLAYVECVSGRRYRAAAAPRRRLARLGLDIYFRPVTSPKRGRGGPR